MFFAELPSVFAENWQSWTLLVVYLLIALVFSFLCSIAEAAMLKVNRGYIDAIRESNKRAAAVLERFQLAPEEPLSAILTLNTVAHTIGAAGVGHQAAVLFGEQWLGICSAIMTVLILVGSEIIPKTLGATYWRTMAPPAAISVRFLEILLKPFIVVLMALTDRMTKQSASQRSRIEIESTIRHASGSREVSDWERSILNNVFTLKNLPIKDIMTPRVVVFHLQQDTTVKRYRDEFAHQTYSRIPIYGKNKDDITGYVLRDDILEETDETKPLRALQRKLLTIPETISAATLLESISGKKAHMALVVNERGDVSGIVTLEDAIEKLMDIEIVDELDKHWNMRLMARQQKISKKRQRSQEDADKAVPKKKKA